MEGGQKMCFRTTPDSICRHCRDDGVIISLGFVVVLEKKMARNAEVESDTVGIRIFWKYTFKPGLTTALYGPIFVAKSYLNDHRSTPATSLGSHGWSL
jgi:hypothetical protein